MLLLSRPRNNEGAGKAGCQPHPMASYARRVGVVRALQSPQEGRTSGFPCTTNVTAYAGSARVSPRRRPSPRVRLATRRPAGRLCQRVSLAHQRQQISVLPYAVYLGHRAWRRPVASYGIGYPAPATRPTCPRQPASIVIQSTQAMMANAPR